MNRDDIIRMARGAGIDPHDMCEDPRIAENNLKRFAELVAAAEREACAKLCEGLTGRSYEFDMGRLHSAAAIRARDKSIRKSNHV